MFTHKLRLLLLRNWRDIILSLTAVFIVATFLIMMVALNQTYRQSSQNEQLLKGLSCILLIPPPDRTQQNIAECIEANDYRESSTFEFSVPSELEDEPANNTENLDVYIQPPAEEGSPVRVTAAPANNSTIYSGDPNREPRNTYTSVTTVVNPSEPEPLKKIERINPVTGLREWKYEGDVAWILM